MIAVFFTFAALIVCVCRFVLDLSLLTSLLLSSASVPLSLVIRRRHAAPLPAGKGRSASLGEGSRDRSQRVEGRDRSTADSGRDGPIEPAVRARSGSDPAPRNADPDREVDSQSGSGAPRWTEEPAEQNRPGARSGAAAGPRSAPPAAQKTAPAGRAAASPTTRGALDGAPDKKPGSAELSVPPLPSAPPRPPRPDDNSESPASEPATSRPRGGLPRAQQPGQTDKAVNDQRERLHYAFRLFQVQTGQRQLAIGVLDKLLAEPLRIPSFRLAAACLLGEVFRGQADFTHAQQYYELSMQEAEAVPEEGRRRDAYYVHYRPRALLGLTLAMRRNLSPPRQILAMLKDARDQFGSLDAADLPAQLTVLEGLLNRQLGDADGAQVRLREALQGLRGLSPPFLLLWPEHIQALLAQTYLLSNSGRALAGKQARQLLSSADSGPWSLAVAASVLLHLRLDLLLADGAEPAEVHADLAAAQADAPQALLRRLSAAAAAEGDPFLLTECDALHAAWHGAAGDQAATAAALTRLEEHSRGAVAPLGLLRAVESSALWQASGFAATPAIPALYDLRHRGQQALRSLATMLPDYQCSADQLMSWRRCLEGETLPAAEQASYWLGDDLLALRNRTWP